MARGPAGPARVSGALFCLAAAGHTVTQQPAIGQALGPVYNLFWIMSAIGAGLLWAFAGDLFTDRRADPRRWAPAVLLLMIAVVARLAPDSDPVWLVHNIIGAAIAAHALILIVAGWRHDLVEPRRRLRGPVLGAGALYALSIAAVQGAESFGYDASHLAPLAAGLLLLMAMAGGLAFLRVEPALFDPPRPAPASDAIAPQDRADLDRLHKVMDEDEVWRREALAIGDLAGMVGVPEHRLRRLINDALGYRNFAAFLNERRVDAAKALLAAPVRKPVSAIAFEVGFGSLGPFNRAFKEATGETPTAWRARVLAGGSPNPEKAG
jgi:AraC-like DNA-binding protein